MQDTLKEIINKEEVENYEEANYEVKTIIPYVENPIKKTYILDQEELNNLLEGYQEYAEFIISVNKI